MKVSEKTSETIRSGNYLFWWYTDLLDQAYRVYSVWEPTTSEHVLFKRFKVNGEVSWWGQLNDDKKSCELIFEQFPHLMKKSVFTVGGKVYEFLDKE